MILSTSRRTPINDEYPTCERTAAKLLIYPDVIDPAEVSQRLGVIPTSVQIRGREHITSWGTVRTVPLNGWFLSSENVISSKDLRRHLDWLLDVIEPKAEGLLELQQESGLHMTVNCIWWSAAGQGGPTLWPEQMQRLAKLNLECTFDISFYGSDDDPVEDRITTS